MALHDQTPDPPPSRSRAQWDQDAASEGTGDEAPSPRSASSARAPVGRRQARSAFARDTVDELDWPPASSLGRLNGVSLLLLFLALTALGLWQFRSASGTARGLWLVVAAASALAAAFVTYLLIGLRSLHYVLAKDELIVEWLRQRRAIRYDEMLDVTYQPGEPVRVTGRERYWPGFFISTMRMPDGIWHSFATLSPERRVRITTHSAIIALSPHRPVLFLAELARRRHGEGFGTRERMTERRADIAESQRQRADISASRRPEPRPEIAAPPVDTRTHRPTVTPRAPRTVAPWTYAYRHWFREQLLGDSLASPLIAVGVLLPLIMAAVLYSQETGLPSQVPLHWDAHGNPDHFGEPREVWRLPLLALGVFLLNTALATLAVAVDRFLARLLVAITPIVQLVALIALWRIVS
jgi:hypothetical protein